MGNIVLNEQFVAIFIASFYLAGGGSGNAEVPGILEWGMRDVHFLTSTTAVSATEGLRSPLAIKGCHG
jgi:hypothetical protein